MKLLGEGGIGTVLDYDFNFCLKIVGRPTDRNGNGSFWSSCKSAQAWTAHMRFHSGCVKVPVAMRYWIHRDDADNVSGTLSFQDVIRRNVPISCLLPKWEFRFGPELSDYILCSDHQLEKIYENDCRGNIQPVRLFVTYVIQKKEQSVSQYIENGGKFTDAEIYHAFYQILCVIDYLHQRGFSHRDIKPSNILFNKENKKKQFFLTDFDAFHAQNCMSCAATNAFLPHENIMRELKHKFSETDFLTMLDCFALASSLLCMIDGTAYPNSRSRYKLPPEVRKLYEIGLFEPGEIKNIIAELEKNHNFRRQSFAYWAVRDRGYAFDEMGICRFGKLGAFHEQIRFSDYFDPLLKVRDEIIIPPELSDIVLMSLGSDRYNTYFHAPDNLKTGARPRDFVDYTIKSWENTELDSNEKAHLIECGKKLNKYFCRHTDKRCFIPQKEHIVWVDGEIKILWGFGKKIDKSIDYEKYFRFLCGEKVVFTYCDWKTLLLFSDAAVYENAPAEYRQQIFDDMCSAIFGGYERLFKIEQFRQFVAAKASEMSVEEWLAVRKYSMDFDSYITQDIAWTIYQNSDKEQKQTLLRFSEIGNWLQTQIDCTVEEKIKKFFRSRKYDTDNFLKVFPEHTHSNITGNMWRHLIGANPELLKFLPDGIKFPREKKAKLKEHGIFVEDK